MNIRGTIAVVANAYPDVFERVPGHYRMTCLQTLIVPLVRSDIRVDFYGRHWDLMAPWLGLDIPAGWIRGHLPYPEANKVYSSADIVIGLQNYPALVTQRTYEILGSGGFLLTQDTPAVRRLFSPGRDLVVSSTPDDTVHLVRHYLEHPEERHNIRTQGRLTVDFHSYRQRAEQVINVLSTSGVVNAT